MPTLSYFARLRAATLSECACAIRTNNDERFAHSLARLCLPADTRRFLLTVFGARSHLSVVDRIGTWDRVARYVGPCTTFGAIRTLGLTLLRLSLCSLGLVWVVERLAGGCF